MIKRILPFTAVLVMLLATPAYATWVRPSSAPLLDEAGVESGCDFSVSGGDTTAGPTAGPYAGSPGWVTNTTVLDCTHGWTVVEYAARRQVVNADGTRGIRFIDGSWRWVSAPPSPDPVQYIADGRISPCLLRTDGSMRYPGTSDLAWLLRRGSHAFIVGGWAKVNEDKFDRHPYMASVEKVITVTCTRERRAYR
jgi:hypothetical protein